MYKLKSWGSVKKNKNNAKIIHFIVVYKTFKTSVIDHLHISDMILKLYIFDIFLLELFPLQWTNWFLFHTRAMKRTKNLSKIFF